MLYSGIFRSLDQSVDPKGQLYKVLIFTGYDPNNRNSIIIGEDERGTNVGPYPTKRIRVGMSGVSFIYRYIPDIESVVNLTMTDHPFTVEYEGDTDNVHKPYRCSSATVSFLQENLNTDFINSIGNGVMVVLLKWKNEVIQQGSQMVNTITSETLPITNYIYEDPITQRQNRYFHDFIPWKYDKFCYDVEWTGFATPEMLNVEYDHITDRFSLNCQDALSTLQYMKFDRTDQLETIQETLFKMLYKLGTYKDVYITNSVHFNNGTGGLYTYITPLTGPAMKHLVHQQDNFIDEDGEPIKYFDVLEKMMDYLSLTAIPYKDSLWIVSNEGLAMGHTTYRHFNMEISTRLWILPVETTLGSYYTDMGDVDISDTAVLTGSHFCGGTDISSNIIYNKVKVVCDEMRPDPLLPDLNSDSNYTVELPAQNQPIERNLHDSYVSPSGPITENYHYFEMYMNRPADDVDDIKCYCYPNIGANYNNWNGTPHEVTDEDLIISHNIHVPGTSSGATYDAVKGVTGDASALEYGCMACLAEHGDVDVSSDTEQPKILSLNKDILIAEMANYTNVRRLVTTNIHDYDDKANYWNPLVYIKSKPFLANGKQYININGSFEFFTSVMSCMVNGYQFQSTPGQMGWFPCRQERRVSGDNPNGIGPRFDTNHNYIWMKIKLGNRYLTNNGRGSYAWSTAESFVRLWCNDDEMTAGGDWRFHSFNLETTSRGIEGITIKLPVSEGLAYPYQLEIWIDRPLGPGADNSVLPLSTLIHGLDVNVYSSEYVESRKRRNPDRDNTEYSNTILEGAIEEMPEIDLIHSSCDTAGLSYAETARKEEISLRPPFVTTRYVANPQVFNEGAGHYGLPEQVKIETLRNQGITPTVVMRTRVFNNVITPISRVFWSWLEHKPFIVDSISIDYEYEQCDANLVEIKQPSEETISVERTNRTRNLYRTRDIIFDGHIARRNIGALQPVIPISTGVNNPANTDTPVVLTTDDDMAGTSSLNVDWSTGQARLSTSPISGVSANNNNGQVVITL